MLGFRWSCYIQSNDKGILTSEGVDERVMTVIVNFDDGYSGGQVVGAVGASEGCEGVFASGQQGLGYVFADSTSSLISD